MNGRRFYLLLVLVFLMTVLSLSAAFAQETTETPEATTAAGTETEMASCDSDLILMWYVAERFFNFSSFNSQLSADMMIDVDRIDRGQFTSRFDEIDTSSSLDLSDEARSSVNDALLLNDADFATQMSLMGDTSMTSLSIGAMDEADECAALRASLRRFFFGLAQSDAGMASVDADTDGSDSDDTDDTDTSTDSSPEGALTVNLTGATEVPGPGDEDASGTATVYLRTESNEVCVDITIQNITFPATAAHIHQAAAGQSGPPVVTLTTPSDNGLSNTCTTVDAALMQEMVNNPQNFYINVHNGEFPDGAARGQLQ